MRAWVFLVLVAACGDNFEVNRPPTAEAFSLTTQEDLSVTRVVVAEDLDGDELEVLVPIPPSHGTVTTSGLSLTYAPAPDYHGPDQFALVLTDGENESLALDIDVTVQSAADAPNGGADSIATNEDTVRNIDSSLLLANDSDVDGDPLAITAVGQGVNGVVSLAGTTVSFTPAADFTGGGSFVYTLSDGELSTEVTVEVVIGGVQDPPVAGDDTATTAEDTPLTLTEAQLVTNDTDADGQILTISGVSNAQSGTVAQNGTTITFTPDANFVGTASFEYTVTDGIASDTGRVDITVTAVNDPPTAVNDAISQTGAANVIPHATLLANDSDGGDGGTKTITAVGNAVNGTVSLEATTVTFTPNEGFAGAASFEYTMSDDGGTSTSTATVDITVTTARVCGDGNVEAPEACDDDDTDPDDGCSATCTVEPGFDCTGEPSSCAPECNDGILLAGEACDDGNQNNLDGCTTACVIAPLCNATTFPGGDRFAVDPATGHCFVAFDDTAVNFDGAQGACIAQGGYLATITSEDENEVFTTVLGNGQNPWIGASDDGNDTDDVFSWVTGETFDPDVFENFASGQPDDDVNDGGQGDCLHVFNAAGEWNDTNCALSSFVVGQICEYEPDHCGDSILHTALGEECDDGGNVDGDGCSSICTVENVFFSEYVEGSTDNKALEIANPLSAPFDLSLCTLSSFVNGSAVSAPRFTFPPLTSIPGRDVLVVCAADADASLLGRCDLTTNNNALSFNGDDALQLSCGLPGPTTVVLDIIGQLGFDPGAQWGSGLVSTADNTLRRKCGITHGDTNGANDFEPQLAAEWTGLAQDTFDGLGDPACAP